MGLRITTQPTLEVVTLEEVKAQCRVTHNGEDTWLTNLRVAARVVCENLCQRSFLETSWSYTLPRFPPGRERIILPRPALKANSTAIQYYDASGNLNAWVVSFGDYQESVYEEPAFLVPNVGEDWPQTQAGRSFAVEIDYKSGVDAVALVPQPIKQAILMLCSHWYKHREPIETGTFVQNVPYAVEHLLAPYIMRHFTPLGAVA